MKLVKSRFEDNGEKRPKGNGVFLGGVKNQMVVRSTNVTYRHCQVVHSVRISSHCDQSFTTEVMYDKAKIGQKKTKTGKMPFSQAQHEPDFTQSEKQN